MKEEGRGGWGFFGVREEDLEETGDCQILLSLQIIRIRKPPSFPPNPSDAPQNPTVQRRMG